VGKRCLPQALPAKPPSPAVHSDGPRRTFLVFICGGTFFVGIPIKIIATAALGKRTIRLPGQRKRHAGRRRNFPNLLPTSRFRRPILEFWLDSGVVRPVCRLDFSFAQTLGQRGLLVRVLKEARRTPFVEAISKLIRNGRPPICSSPKRRCGPIACPGPQEKETGARGPVRRSLKKSHVWTSCFHLPEHPGASYVGLPEPNCGPARELAFPLLGSPETKAR